MSTTQSNVSESPDTPMEVVIIEEDEDTATQEEKLNKKPEGSRKNLGKT